MAAELERVDHVDGQVPLPGMPQPCTCGPGAWGSCDQCGAEAWVKHHCGFPCDDVTCENGSLCIGCLTGRPCPVHNADDWEDDWDDEYDPVEQYVPVSTVIPLARYL